MATLISLARRERIEKKVKSLIFNHNPLFQALKKKGRFSYNKEIANGSKFRIDLNRLSLAQDSFDHFQPVDPAAEPELIEGVWSFGNWHAEIKISGLEKRRHKNSINQLLDIANHKVKKFEQDVPNLLADLVLNGPGTAPANRTTPLPLGLRSMFTNTYGTIAGLPIATYSQLQYPIVDAEAGPNTDKTLDWKWALRELIRGATRRYDGMIIRPDLGFVSLPSFEWIRDEHLAVQVYNDGQKSRADVIRFGSNDEYFEFDGCKFYPDPSMDEERAEAWNTDTISIEFEDASEFVMVTKEIPGTVVGLEPDEVHIASGEFTVKCDDPALNAVGTNFDFAAA